jgi:integrative and conjugative element protein (TIGR02256 family)
MRQPYSRVILARSVLQTIDKEARRFWFKETGGALVGYVDQSFSVVVVSASGPGLRAKHSYSHVQLDGAFVTRFCEKWRTGSHGVIDYVGDWHTHISSSIRPSATDIEALSIMEPFTASPSFLPVSLIRSRFTREYGVFMLSDSKIVSVHCDELEDHLVRY